MKALAVLSSLVATLALSTSCGADSEDPTEAPTSPAPSTTQEPAPTEPPSSDLPGAEEQTHKPSGPYDLTLRGVSVMSHDGRDRVVLRFSGTGRPGWAARFVDEAVLEGSGRVVELDGDAILRLDISGTPTRTPQRSGPVRTELGGDVVDLHSVGAYEGVTQVFLGLDGGRTAFQVSARTKPSRLVVDIE
jgi:hypothetical protein